MFTVVTCLKITYFRALGRESALALNSLHPDGWLAYGTSAWKVTFLKQFCMDVCLLPIYKYILPGNMDM
jgi:hypothetical protein